MVPARPFKTGLRRRGAVLRGEMELGVFSLHQKNLRSGDLNFLASETCVLLRVGYLGALGQPSSAGFSLGIPPRIQFWIHLVSPKW